MALSHDARDAAISQVEQFCASQVADHLSDDIRLETEVKGSRIRIVELRAPWDPQIGSKWSRQPIAELRYDGSGGAWALYWPRHTGRWLLYDGLPAASEVGPLLAEIEADPDGVFWG